MRAFVPQSIRRMRHVAAYLLAFILPALCTIANVSFAPLQIVPFSLNFLSIALVAMVGGLLPALIAFVLSGLSRDYVVVTTHHRPLQTSDAVGIFLLLLCALLFSTIRQKWRRSSEERQNALDALQERTNALVDSLYSSRCASWVIDTERKRIVRWYGDSYQVFGRPFREIEELDSMASLIHPDDQDRFHELVNRMKTSWEPIVFEYRFIRPDEKIHWLEFRGTRVADSPNLWRGVTVDVTTGKLAEAALLRSEKLAAMGRLASTVAHEINNPLEAVTNLLFLARQDSSLSEEVQSYLATAEIELARLGDITRLTLGFVRSSATRQNVRVADTVEEVLSIFRHRYEMKSIQVERLYQPGVCITIAPHELRQIVTNLISNAVDATEASGACVSIHIRHEQGKAVLLIEDNGVGIPEAQLSRIFEPFFTTKGDVGTGIGLWVTRELVEKNGGHISLTSGDLAGKMKTSFRIEFPLSPIVLTHLPPSEAAALQQASIFSRATS